MNSSKLCDIILDKLKQEKIFDGITAAQIAGNNFSAADIAVLLKNGKKEIFRVAVIKYDSQSN